MSLTAVYQNELKRTRLAVANALQQHWHALPDYRDDSIPVFLDKALPLVLAGQRRAVSLTDAYMSRKLHVSPVGLDVDSLIGASVRNGVDPVEVYKRPFVTVWGAIETLGFDAAIAKGLSRLTSTADMDVALSARDASKAYGQASGGHVSGFLRRADPGCCAFCQMIDGAYVKSDSAAPLHNRCGCTLEPIATGSPTASTKTFASVAPGAVFDDVEIQEHGELGPVITNKHNHFTGPNDLGHSDYIES